LLYALDTNIYLNAQRNSLARAGYDRILKAAGRRLRLPAVVAFELRAGVRSPEQRAALDQLVNAYAARDRILVPSAAAFLEAGRVIADLAIREGITYGAEPLSLANDALIAASCREMQVTLATNNHADFARIQRHCGDSVLLPQPPWRERAADLLSDSLW